MILRYLHRPHRAREVASRAHPDSTACRGYPSPPPRTRSMLTASTPGAPRLARTFSHAPIDEALVDLKRLHLRLRSHPRLLPRDDSHRVGLGLTVDCPAPSLQPHYRAFIATTSRSRPCAPHRYSATHGLHRSRSSLSLTRARPTSRRLPVSSGIETTGSPVPCQRLRRAHATSTPGTARGHTQAAPLAEGAPRIATPLSRRLTPQDPVSMPSFDLSMRQQWFTHVRLLVAHLTR